MAGIDRLFLASGNPHKVQELQALAHGGDGPPVEIVSASRCGGMPPVNEDAGTFVGNARKKARALQSRAPSDAWLLADDSGLCVDALDGAPGVESATFAGEASDSSANLAKLVHAMREVPEARRSAHFVCVFVLLGPGGEEHVFEGRCDGRLVRQPTGQGGFGYDPLFVPAGEQMTFAELGDEKKNRLSHRARAWSALAAWLRRR